MALLLVSAPQQTSSFQTQVVKDVLVEIATTVLHSLSISENPPAFDESILKKIETIDPYPLCMYLNAGGKKHIRDLTNIVYTCIKRLISQHDTDEMHEIFAFIVASVKKAVVLVNGVHKEEVTVQATIGQHEITVIVEVLFSLVLSIMFPSETILMEFLKDLFQLIELQIVPLEHSDVCSLFKTWL